MHDVRRSLLPLEYSIKRSTKFDERSLSLFALAGCLAGERSSSKGSVFRLRRFYFRSGLQFHACSPSSLVCWHVPDILMLRIKEKQLPIDLFNFICNFSPYLNSKLSKSKSNKVERILNASQVIHSLCLIPKRNYSNCSTAWCISPCVQVISTTQSMIYPMTPINSKFGEEL